MVSYQITDESHDGLRLILVDHPSGKIRWWTRSTDQEIASTIERVRGRLDGPTIQAVRKSCKPVLSAEGWARRTSGLDHQ